MFEKIHMYVYWAFKDHLTNFKVKTKILDLNHQ